jgi:hypothetical protein
MWEPLSRAELDALIASELAVSAPERRDLFARHAIVPEKWTQHPWGDDGGGFWAVAVCGDRVLWYNEIEEGFNVSRFAVLGRISEGQCWCNQDALGVAVCRLVEDLGRLGPPISP